MKGITIVADNTLNSDVLAKYITQVENLVQNEWPESLELGSISPLNQLFKTGITFLAIFRDEVIGFVQLIQNDLDTHQELTFWLVNAFVAKKFRELGVATHMIKSMLIHDDDVRQNTIHIWCKPQLSEFWYIFNFTKQEIIHTGDIHMIRTPIARTVY